jgi:hypothetical protein
MPQLAFYEVVPNAAWRLGRTWRKGVCRQSDGTLSEAKTEEYFLTLKLPWSRKIYCINRDEPIQANRFIIRFKWGWA